ncbi:T9SS C-terminal target domain-containing protein, partial [candidate division KSB1 bacterium]
YPPPITQPADTVRLMLNNWFVDVDGDPLDFKVAAHSDPTVVSYSLSNDLLTITAQARGTATLTIEADDSYGGLSAHQVTVTVNSLPVRNTTPFPVDYVRPNNPATIDNLNDFFDDPDMDVLAFTAANSDPDVISADILGSSLLLEPQKVDSDRRVIITITASDSFWGVIKIPYELTNVNSRPRPLAFTPVTMYPTQIKSIPFSTLFIDSDDDPLDYTASSENDSVAIAWTVADTLYIEAQKTDSTRVTTIHISADDGRSLSGPANADFMLTVNNSPIEVVPHAKVLLNFPPEGGENADVETINLADVFIDDDPLVYAIEAVQGDFADATLSGDGNSLILTAQSSGTSLVTVAADDQQGSYANFTFTVNVNTPPTLVQKDSLFSAFMGTNRLHFRIPLNYTQAIYLPHFFTDIDEDKIYYELVSDENNKSITAVILIDSLYVTAMGSGAAFVDVKPYDKRGSADSIRIPVQVNRQPQRIKDISDAKRKPGNRHVVPDIHSYFSDADNDRLTFSAQSSDEAIAMAWVANDTLYISSDGADSTSTVFITVSAKDDYGGYTATGFSITFQNKSPYPSSDWRDTLFDRNIFTGQQVSIQIGDIFLDDDGDPLALAAMSEDTSIVTARINDSTLILAAKGVGRCKATVSADDSYGGISALSFEVKVLSLSPIKKQDIADTVLTRGAPVPLTIDLYSRFADPLNNPLNFTVVSTADPKIAHASIQNDTILVIELDPAAPADASASISVYAKNDYGSEFTTFEIDVNVKPEIKQGKRIQNKWLKVGDKALKIDLSEIFEDEDVEDSLKFYAFSKNEQVAFALTSRDTLIVALNTPQPGDSAMIVYSADDAHDFGVKVDSFVVLPTARPPDISLYAEKDIQMSRGSPAVIRATVVDETAIDTSSVKIKYWHLDDSHEKAEQKGYLEDVNAKIYRFELPAEFFQDRSVVFQLYATNEYDSTGCSDIFVKPVHVNTLTRSEPQPLGTEQTAYRLVSFPLLLDNPSPRDVFAAWGTYNPTTWRLFETIYQDGEESFVEFQDIQQLQLGCAYWLITTQAGRKISTGPGQTAMPNDPDMLFEIPLHKGWNYVGNPFNFEIPLQNVRLAKSGKKEIRQFDAVGDGNVDWIKITPDSSFVPFQGYIFWSEFDEDTLLINPVVSDSLMANSETMAQHDTLWSINVAAQCQLANDRYNHAIVATDALTTLDILDEPEPPVFGQYVSVYFYQPEWDYPTNCFAADARPDINEGESWTLHARTNINDKIALTFAGMADVPDDYEVWLFDQALKITQDLRLDSIYTIAGSNAASPRALELVVGRPSYVNKLKQEMDLVPKDYVLFQNFPNPFNPSTTIRFGLPEDSDVTLKIYNILGEQVVSLLDHQHHRAGYHAVVWDGKNNHALLVSNGVYVYRLEAGSRTMVKKMAFVK